MITLEFKLKGKETQYRIVDEMIRTFQFVRNKCLRFWMDGQKVKLSEVNAEATKIRHNPEFPWAGQLESSSAQAASERAMTAIRRFYENCKAGVPAECSRGKQPDRETSLAKKAILSSKKRIARLSTNRLLGS